MVSFSSLVVIGIAIIFYATIDANPSLFIFDAVLSTPGMEARGNSFAGKNVWFTGASSGIGAELAIQLCEGGANVLISARRVNELETLQSKCSSIKM